MMYGSLKASSGSSYLVEKTIFLNLCSQYSDGSVSFPANINILKPDNADLQVNNAYTSPDLKDVTGALTGITLKNSGAFSVTQTEISPDQTSAGNTGVYENGAVNSGWSVNTDTNAKINLLGLNSAKFYQMYFLMPMYETMVRSVTVSGSTKNRSSVNSASSFGTAGNGLNDPEFIVFNNITGVTSIEAAINRVSGAYGAVIALIVIEQTNISKI